MPSRGTLVLCYHAVSEHWEAPLAVTPDRLERQVSRLLASGYVGTTFSRAVLDPPAKRSLAVTFDDACRSVGKLAGPILRDLGLPGTVFAPTSFIGSERPMSWPGIAHWAEGAHAHELIPMSWRELGRLSEEGWEIGSHTHRHPRLPALDREAAIEELETSRRECEAALGAPCRALAYPYGAYSAETVAAAQRVGYVAAGTLGEQLNRPSHLAWPRVGIYRRDSDPRFRLKVSPTVRRIQASSAWRLHRGPAAL